ncbi:MAG: EF-P lysine aminoacylase GenX [Leptospiraceae bacterium]|nr:EF-P lysine aminoacylase GenX [Leptospiraceae bacterium]
MNELPIQTLIFRSKFIQTIRSFFLSRNFVELDTPILNPVPGMEPYLDPFEVYSPDKREKGYLFTSPEYSLKQSLSMGLERIFEFSHSFRSGERGLVHTSEFIMLEFYIKGINEQELILFCEELLGFLDETLYLKKLGRHNITKKTMDQLFTEILDIGLSREELLRFIRNEKVLLQNPEEAMYEDLFFIIFLNYIEPKLPEGPLFVYDYPPELSALARIEEGKAKRFEIYWKGIELGNGFYELTDYEEQKRRFENERKLRQSLGKEAFPDNVDFMKSLKRGLPECSGIAIGLDRLLMLFLGLDSLQFVSPYYQSGRNE